MLEELHEECTSVIKDPAQRPPAAAIGNRHDPEPSSASRDDHGWLEVGPKQKAAITRSSGFAAEESPITSIFGGKLRSELRVPGAKNSVTLEPYQSLQLDIGSPHVDSIIDALKGLTRPEILHGDFHSPRGAGISATKQVFIESLPPVLILHLKRFQYDNFGGTQKIWKNIAYPLELELPEEVFPSHQKTHLISRSYPAKYRLSGVIYHHGKSASGGHYTVDVRRQDNDDWIRLDDTSICSVRSKEVAEGGFNDGPKLLEVTVERHRGGENVCDPAYASSERERLTQVGGSWNGVNGQPSVARGSAALPNGTKTPTQLLGRKSPVGRVPAKDNKVAYLLFYQRVDRIGTSRPGLRSAT